MTEAGIGPTRDKDGASLGLEVVEPLALRRSSGSVRAQGLGRVDRIEPAGDHQLVLAFVDGAEIAPGKPLVRYERTYRRLTDD